MIDITGEEEKPRTVSDEVRHWLNELAASRRREQEFRKEGQRINEIYEGEKKEQTPFNILFSNTETMLPSIYSMVPRPVVKRRFKDDDKTGKSAAVAAQRLLEFLLDTNIDGYETFNSAMTNAALSGLLPGRGVTAVKYDADVVDVPEDEAEAIEDVEAAEPTPYVLNELVCTESIIWDRVWFGYARSWSKVPWVAYETHLDKEECVKLFGDAMANRIDFTKGEELPQEDEFYDKDEEEQNIGERKTALIYQIWDKDGGRVLRYVSPHMTEDFLKVEPDPLGLTGFFNCPEPLQFVRKLSNMVPTPIYALYENQARELNRLSQRIIAVIDAIKAKGVYDGALGDDIQNLMEAAENELVPTDGTTSLAAEKGLDNAIWFWPVEKLIVVLQQLYQAREAAKQVIYEITGIADIMRGSSNASETLGAQEIKQQWGTLRLKRLQKEVQRYARDLLRMILEVAAQKFSPETWAKMTGLPFVMKAEKEAAQAEMQAVTAQYQQQAMLAQQQGMQPPPAPQPDQRITFALEAPVWEEVLALLKDDIQRAYRIDIETNTTIEAEAAEDQKNIAEVMNALAQYLNGVGPLVIQGILPFEAAQAMMLAIIRRFRFGDEIEDYITQMKPPQPQGDDGKSAAAAADLKSQQDKLAMDSKAAQDQLSIQKERDQMALERIQLKAESKAEKDLMEIDFERKLLDAQKALFEAQKRLAENDLSRATDAAKGEIAVAAQKSTIQLQGHAEKVQGMVREYGKQTKNGKDPSGGANDAIKEVQKVVLDVAEAIRDMSEKSGAPKSVERDESGRIKSIGGRTVVRDENGRAVSVE